MLEHGGGAFFGEPEDSTPFDLGSERRQVPAEYARLVDVAMRVYIKEHDYADTCAKVLLDLRATHEPDFGKSAGGRWMIEIFTSRTLRARYWR